MRWLMGPVALVALIMLAVTPPAAANTPDRFGRATPVVVVLDTSGSMAQDSGGVDGGTRIQAARSAVLDLIQSLQPDRQYGMVTYPGGTSASGCTPGIERTTLGALNVPAASADIRHAGVADGDTPTSAALLHAGDILTSSGRQRAVIVLVSDGEANCGPDPCQTADKLRTKGLDVIVNTVGFHVSDDGAQQLKCIAAATGGRYTKADDRDGLAEALQAATQAQLTGDLTVPDVIPAAVGTGTSGTTVATATVTNTGRLVAGDVRATLTFTSDAGKPGNVGVADPVFYVGNLAPGQTTEARFAIRPDPSAAGAAIANLTVTSINAAPLTLTASTRISLDLSRNTLGPLFAHIDRVAVMGDSYSSGEGVGSPYLPGTTGQGSDDACHRSARTYAGDLWGNDAAVIACSGAVTADFFTPQTSNGKQVEPQLIQLEKALQGPKPPQAVLLSIGGNDVGFANLVTRCVKFPSCLPGLVGGPLPGDYTDIYSYYRSRATNVTPDINRVLRAVNGTLNTPARVAARGGTSAPIIVMPYPRIIPPSFADVANPNGCMFGLSGAELKFLNTFFDDLNTSVSLAALQLHNAGEPVYLASDVENAFQPDHTICEGEAASYANFTTRSKTHTPAALSKMAHNHGLLHPNAAGHRAEAQALASWSHSRIASPIKTQTAAEAAADSAEFPPPLLRLTHPSWLASWLGSPGSWVHIFAAGFEPGSQVVTRLESRPTVVAAAVADANGRVDIWARLPIDATPGSHHLVRDGMDPVGDISTVSKPFRIVGPGGLYLPLGALVGAVVLVAGLILWRQRNMQARICRRKS